MTDNQEIGQPCQGWPGGFLPTSELVPTKNHRRHSQYTPDGQGSQSSAPYQDDPTAGLLGLLESVSEPLSEVPQNQPPPSNRGVTWQFPSCKVTCGLDWLGYSVRSDIRRDWAFVQHPKLIVTGERLRPRPGYDMAVGLSFGRLDWHTQRPEQRLGVQFSGSEVAGLLALGISNLDLLAYMVEQVDGSTSRVDFAIDYYAPGDVLDIHREWESGLLETSARKLKREITEHHGRPDQVTVYVGSRHSHRFLRAYTKGLKEGAPFDWLRVELEMKGRYAGRWVDAALEHGITEAGCAAIRDFCTCHASWYMEAVAGDAVNIAPVGRKRTGRMAWLLDVVLPLVARELLDEKRHGRRELREALAAVLENTRTAHSGE
jgi:Putative phage replication protein RstA